MKLPTSLIPPLPSSTTAAAATSAAGASGTSASMFAARLGDALGGVPGAAPGGAPGAANMNAAVEPAGEESSDSSAANALTDPADAGQPGHLARAGTDSTPSIDAAMAQLWAGTQIPAVQPDTGSVIVATPLVPVSVVAGEALAPGLDGSTTVPARVQAAGQPPASGSTPATAAHPGGVPANDGGAGAPTLAAVPASGGTSLTGGAPAAANGLVAAHTVAASASATAAVPARPGAAADPVSLSPAPAASATDAVPVDITVAAAVAASTTAAPANPALRANAALSVPTTAPTPVAGTGQQLQAGAGGGAAQLSGLRSPAGAGAGATPSTVVDPNAAVPESSRQAVDAAAAPTPSSLPAASTAGLPAAVALPAVPAQPPVLAAGGAQQAVPPGTPMLSEQLARPLFALAGAPLGEHVMTINVIPDALGPVTVRAHLAADGIRIEMMSASDAGREGLRNILVDLRRDLAAGGLAASLSMGSGNGGQDHGGSNRSPQESGRPWGSAAVDEEQHAAPQRERAPSEVPTAANNSLDITV